jgi:hypothetical protein
MHPLNGKVRGDKYRKPASLLKVYEPCFPTLDLFVEALGEDDADDFPPIIDTKNMANCTDLAHAAWHHQVEGMDHFYFDTQHVTRLIDWSGTETTILIVRREALWDDWISANQWLGQDVVQTYPDIVKRDSAGKSYPVGKDISDQNRITLCLSLKSEYGAYLKLVSASVNLGQAEKQDALDYSRKKCPELNLSFDTS